MILLPSWQQYNGIQQLRSNMFKYLTNSFTGQDGGQHDAAIAAVSKLTVLPINSIAYVSVEYFHDLTHALAGVSIQGIFYDFMKSPPEGKHDYDAVFIPGQNQSLNLFNYIKALPEFAGWTEV